MMKQYLTVQEFADDLQVSPRTVRNWIRRGLITPIRIGARTIRIERSEVRRVIGRGRP